MKYGKSSAGWRDVGDKRCFFRSRWEANYARYLELQKSNREIAGWKHESKTFWFESIRRGIRSYKPDFEVLGMDGSTWFVEVKGFMDKQSATKLKRMKIHHKHVTVLLVDQHEYLQIEKSVLEGRIKILDWEYKNG